MALSADQIRIVPLLKEHLSAAASLAAEAYEEERRKAPLLPDRGHARCAGEIEPMLGEWLDRAPGAAAFHDDRLCGYLLGIPVENFKGRHRGVYVAEWAHAAAQKEGGTAGRVDGSQDDAGGPGQGNRHDHRGLIYRKLYEALSPEWVRNGYMTHVVTLYAHGSEALDAWFRSGFGMMVVDAVRDVSPAGAPAPQGIDIRRASAGDLPEVVRLSEAQKRYMARAPIFMPLLHFPSIEERREFLEKPENALFLAFCGDEAIAYIQCEPEGDGAAWAVRAPDKVAITGAYTEDAHRGKGVASALLDSLVSHARASGYRRLSVDFESFNIYGSRFWLRHFAPVCYSVIRRLDDRVLWATADRPRESQW